MKPIHFIAIILGISLLIVCIKLAIMSHSNVAGEAVRDSVISNIMTRSSVRSYTDEPVSAKDAETLLRAGMAAPTACNKQPWFFVAVDDRAVLNSLAEANPNASMLKKAPFAIVVCGDMSKALEGEAQEFWVQDTSAATENILLAANALGLGAVWTGLYPMKDRAKAVADVLGLPEKMIPLCTIVIGHPDSEPQIKDKWTEENYSWNKYDK